MAQKLRNGSQATIYLSPRDYHRVHAPFAGRCVAIRHLPGKLFPVNPGAQRAIPKLFARNERVVFEFELPGGIAAAVVMVAALNVGDIRYGFHAPKSFEKAQELGRFGFGSTSIFLVAAAGPQVVELAAETPVKMGAAAT